MLTLNCNGRLLSLETPVVMGILNVTPDSFYAGSRVADENKLLRKTELMLSDGASILDIGAQSTRPGSEAVSADEELKRVIPMIGLMHKYFPEAVISVDTYYATVAKQAVEAGASMINDISAGELDSEMMETVGRLRVPYICMHMRGTPQNMQSLATYDNVLREVLDYFIEKIEACRQAGIHDVIIDPGFGFAKTIAQNFHLLKNLRIFQMLEKPLLVGVSRKATVYKTLGITAEEALNGTTVLNTIALMNGAHILRVHDVKEAVEAVKLFQEVHSS
jgi:dihydropteroate synthase